jgi:hypothetical protein
MNALVDDNASEIAQSAAGRELATALSRRSESGRRLRPLDRERQKSRKIRGQFVYTHAIFSVLNSVSPSHRYATSGPPLATL